MVRQYLVTGNRDLVSDQEIVYFMNICRARSLNPFNRECYLIKYTQAESAAIIVSIEKLRMVARQSEDCVGWERGIIVKKADGEIRYSKGLILDGEVLLGGYFKAKPKGWETPFELEVNLKGYIKKTKEGNATRFWSADNQPTMIAKVAEAQGLRTVWPEKVQGLYIQEEIGSAAAIDVDFSEKTEMPKWAFDPPESPMFQEFVAATMRANRSTEAQLRTAANEAPEAFLSAYNKWLAKQTTGSEPPPTPSKPTKPRKKEAIAPHAEPPAVNHQPEREPGDEQGEPQKGESAGVWSEEMELDALREDLAGYEQSHKHYVLEAKKRTGISHAATIDGLTRLIEEVKAVIAEKAKG
jgi:phage recombination protein Bet